MEKDEAMEKAKKAAVVNHRMNQFLWGWTWYGVFDIGLKLVGAVETPTSPWLLLFLFVVGGALALHFQKKVLGVGFSFDTK